MKKHVPMIVFVGSAVAYTIVNMTGIFAKWFGCGCVDGFNANDLSLCFYVISAGVSVILSERAFKGADRKIRLAHYSALTLCIFLGFIPFSAFNSWL